MDRASQRIEPSLAHHRMTMDDLAQAGASGDLLRCYLELCDEAALRREATPAPAA